VLSRKGIIIALETKARTDKWHYTKFKKLLHIKGNNKQSKKTTNGMGRKPLSVICLTED
jgi:hypothetical protein